jgi:hypothetical protein
MNKASRTCAIAGGAATESGTKSRRQRISESRTAARKRRTVRELRIVALLNSGIAMPEIAARESLSERRVRQLVQDILDRRAPRAPAEYAALQVSRLNEAMHVAYAAMTDGNLDAVDRVMKLARELDRYHGFAALGLPRREPSLSGGSHAPLALVSPGDGKEIAAQTIENTRFSEEKERV